MITNLLYNQKRLLHPSYENFNPCFWRSVAYHPKI
jgi:hypothetical protein